MVVFGPGGGLGWLVDWVLVLNKRGGDGFINTKGLLVCSVNKLGTILYNLNFGGTWLAN